jgi:hypothetical protein
LNNLVSRDGEAMRLTHSPVGEMPAELKNIIEDKP